MVYQDPIHFSTPITDPQTVEKQNQIRARHEIVNGKIKGFCPLHIFLYFRHDPIKHNKCFFTVSNIVHLMIEYDGPLYELDI